LYSKYYPKFDDFKQTLTDCIQNAHTKHRDELETLLAWYSPPATPTLARPSANWLLQKRHWPWLCNMPDLSRWQLLSCSLPGTCATIIPDTRLLTGLFFLTGVALLVAGIFPTDEFGRRITLSGKIHAIAGILLIISACLTLLAIALVEKRGGGLRLYSLITGLVLALLFVFLPNGVSPVLIQMHKTVLGGCFDFWYANHGLCQWLIFGVYFFWL
jgi:hypothetical protein